MISENECTGCGACAASCPVNAIAMLSDYQGFKHPKINNDLCIGCNKCEKVCPVPRKKINSEVLLCLGAFAKDSKVRMQSTSGGVFTLLAEEILNKNGIVVGCKMSNDCSKAEHVLVDNVVDLEKLRGSKYIQSDLNDTFKQIKQCLKNNRYVLFSGTPCQVAGLKTYLETIDQSKLFLIDFICHGTPSPNVWKRYKEFYEKKENSLVIKNAFRDKISGWQKYSLTMQFSNMNKYVERVTESLYLKGFVLNLYLRPSCYSCRFKNDNYYSDITLGDFWGVTEIIPDYADDKGVSLIVAHTDKGVKAINEILDMIEFKKVNIEEATRNNPSYNYKTSDSEFRSYFWDDFNKIPIDKAIKRYVSESLIHRIRRCLIKRNH